MPALIVPMPISELADRYTIAQLKLQRLHLTPEEEHSYRNQVSTYALGLDLEDPVLSRMVQDLYEVNALLWDAEAAITKANEDDEPMEVIGRLALTVRERNRTRAQVKNKIVVHTGRGFIDVKGNYGMPLAAPSTASSASD